MYLSSEFLLVVVLLLATRCGANPAGGGRRSSHTIRDMGRRFELRGEQLVGSFPGIKTVGWRQDGESG
jgi:hypothetical protein